jgi:hypothetical protein
MTSEVELASWLHKMLEANPDLRTSSGVPAEARRLPKIAKIVIHEDGLPIGYAELRRVSRAIELATVVVDEAHRGRGHCHTLVQSGWERWRQDPILHGRSVMPEVDLSKVMSGGEIEEITVPKGPLISFTRDAAMAASLVAGGFEMVARRRRPSRLWLWKSDVSSLPINIQIMLAIDRILRGIAMLFRRPSKLLHYIKNAGNYRLFIRKAESAEVPPPRATLLRRESEKAEGVASDVVKHFSAAGFTMAQNEDEAGEHIAWDEGE